MLIFDIGLLMKKFCYTRLTQYYLASQHLGSKKIRKIILSVLLIAGFSASSTAFTCPEGIKPATTNDELVENSYLFIYNIILQDIPIYDVANIKCYFSGDETLYPKTSEEIEKIDYKNNAIIISKPFDNYYNLDITKPLKNNKLSISFGYNESNNRMTAYIKGSDKGFHPENVLNKHFDNIPKTENFIRNIPLDFVGLALAEKYYPRRTGFFLERNRKIGNKDTLIILQYYKFEEVSKDYIMTYPPYQGINFKDYSNRVFFVLIFNIN